MWIGVIPNPREWQHWEQAKAYLEPAAKQGGFTDVLEPDEELFAVIDGELLAVATAWFSVDERFVEVKLVGGKDHRRWLKELNDFVGACAAAAGATQLRAWGRAGWLKSLGALGWDSIKLEDGSRGYSRCVEVYYWQEELEVKDHDHASGVGAAIGPGCRALDQRCRQP